MSGAQSQAREGQGNGGTPSRPHGGEDAAAPITPMGGDRFSPRLAKSLTAAGEKVTDKLVAKLWKSCEKKRGEFAVEAVRLGLVLLAKREALGHGHFQKWTLGFCTSFLHPEKCNHLKIKDNQISNRNHASDLSGEEVDSLTRQIRTFLYLARRYLLALEAGDRLDPQSTLLEAVSGLHGANLHNNLPTLISRSLVSTRGKSGSPSDSIQKSLVAFVAGRSLRQMLTDFREADKAAEQAERDAANTIVLPSGTGADGTTGTAPAKALQTDFFEQLMVRWDTHTRTKIDAIFTMAEERFGSGAVPKAQVAEYWRNVAHDLKVKAEQAAAYAAAATAGDSAEPPPPSIKNCQRGDTETENPTPPEGSEAMPRPAAPLPILNSSSLIPNSSEAIDPANEF